MIPPILLTIRVGRLWLPLPVFVLWPLLLLLTIVAILVLPLVRIRGTTPAQRARWPVFTWQALAAGRGLVVDVREAAGRSVAVRCY